LEDAARRQVSPRFLRLKFQRFWPGLPWRADRLSDAGLQFKRRSVPLEHLPSFDDVIPLLPERDHETRPGERGVLSAREQFPPIEPWLPAWAGVHEVYCRPPGKASPGIGSYPVSTSPIRLGFSLARSEGTSLSRVRNPCSIVAVVAIWWD